MFFLETCCFWMTLKCSKDRQNHIDVQKHPIAILAAFSNDSVHFHEGWFGWSWRMSKGVFCISSKNCQQIGCTQCCERSEDRMFQTNALVLVDECASGATLAEPPQLSSHRRHFFDSGVS